MKSASKEMIVSVALSLSLLGTLAVAGGPHGPHGPHGRGPEGMMERHLEQLGLDAEQKERVQEILAASKAERKASRGELRKAFHEMRTLLEQEKPDETAVMRQAERMGELKTEKHKAMLRTLLAIRAELTPEQREKLKELHGSRRKGFWRDRHHDGPESVE